MTKEDEKHFENNSNGRFCEKETFNDKVRDI